MNAKQELARLAKESLAIVEAAEKRGILTDQDRSTLKTNETLIQALMEQLD